MCFINAFEPISDSNFTRKLKKKIGLRYFKNVLITRYNNNIVIYTTNRLTIIFINLKQSAIK